MQVVGYIGNFDEAKKNIESLNLEAYFVKIIDYKCDIDEIKEFRTFLLTPHIKKKLGIIYYLNFFNEEKQNLLLKIFEEIPFNSFIYFIATSNVNYTLQTRSVCYFINKEDENLKIFMNQIKNKIQNNSFSKNDNSIMQIIFNTYSLFYSDYLSLDEKNNIINKIKL